MATLPVFDKSGNEVGKVDVDANQIASKINHQLLHDATVMYQANERQGSQCTKSRAMVKGSTKKLYRQKGTGNARAGSKRSNIRRGGGHAFARRNRDYYYRLPKKALQTATRMAIAGKIKNEQLVVIDEFDFAKPKTSDMAAILKALNLDGNTTIVATDALDRNVYKSTRNLPGASATRVTDLNAYAVLQPQRMLVTKAALNWIKENMAEASA